MGGMWSRRRKGGRSMARCSGENFKKGRNGGRMDEGGTEKERRELEWKREKKREK